MITDDLRQRLQKYGQDHLIGVLERLDDAKRRNLAQQLERIDLAELQTLYGKREHKDALPERERIQALPRPKINDDDRHDFMDAGGSAIFGGKIAYLIVAGGQGTRLGFDRPKGMFPIGPLSKKTLFQLHAEKVLHIHRRSGHRVPLLVMTSPATDEETRYYFKRKNYFRLPPQDVWFFCQGTMPALDLTTGRLLCEAPGSLGLSPNGHGGTITGLLDCGMLDRLGELGIDSIYYFQVDNPLVNLADGLFVGRHLNEKAKVSSKVLPKTGPMEKVGNFVLVDGKCSMIEYSDLPEAWAHEKDENGQLIFWAGNPAIHLFDVAFLRKITAEASNLPWHLARKKVPYVDDAGSLVKPDKENALKFERFIFDVLPLAERWTILETEREEEFAPIKNKDGVDSPATAQALMLDRARRWLTKAGLNVPDGVKVEISPLMALEAFELEADCDWVPEITRDTHLQEFSKRRLRNKRGY